MHTLCMNGAFSQEGLGDELAGRFRGIMLVAWRRNRWCLRFAQSVNLEAFFAPKSFLSVVDAGDVNRATG